MSISILKKRCTTLVAASAYALVLGTTSLMIGATSMAQAAEPTKGGTLKAIWIAEPRSLYSPRGGGGSTLFLASKMLERLVSQSTAEEFKPELAESWTHAPDHKSITFKLRKANWHDGKPFTSADVKFAFGQVYPKLTSYTLLRNLGKIETPDERTVVIHFKSTSPNFLALATFAAYQAFIVPKHLYEGKNFQKNPVNRRPIGTGPFKFKEWVAGSHVELVRNDDYWEKGLPHLDRIIIRFIRDSGARVAAVEAGEVDLAIGNAFPGQEMKRLGKRKDFNIDQKGYETAKWLTMMEFNTRRPITKNKLVRQAIVFAIDPKFIVNTIYNGLAKVATGPIPSTVTNFYTSNVKLYSYNPKKAEALLDQAGYPRKADGKRFKLQLLSAPWFIENKSMAQYTKQVLGDIGIEVEISTPDRGSAFKQLFCLYNFDITISQSIGQADPIVGKTRQYKSSNIRKCVPFRNTSRYSNPVVDDLIKRASSEIDPKIRKSLLVKWQQIAQEDMPIWHVLEMNMANVVHTKIHNTSTTSQWQFHSWKEVWKEK